MDTFYYSYEKRSKSYAFPRSFPASNHLVDMKDFYEDIIPCLKNCAEVPYAESMM